MSGIAERLAGVLDEHEYIQRGSAICLCGFVPTVDASSLQTQQDYHRAHLAQALLPVVEREIAAARGEAWDEGYTAADFAVHRGIVNPCAVMDRGNPYRAALSPDPERGEGEVGPSRPDHKPETGRVLDLSRMGYGICPKCHEDKFIGHGPLCWECFTGSGEGVGA